MLNNAPLPSEAEQKEAAGAVRAESWYLDINKRELRWESYVKAGYYVSDRYIFGGRMMRQRASIGRTQSLLPSGIR